MILIGLTGGIGSGKSTVSARLAELGARVIDADAITREVQQPGTAVFAAIVDFGLVFQRFLTVSNAAREGARIAVLPGYTLPDVQDHPAVLGFEPLCQHGLGRALGREIGVGAAPGRRDGEERGGDRGGEIVH